jgi:hypothetical protein
MFRSHVSQVSLPAGRVPNRLCCHSVALLVKLRHVKIVVFIRSSCSDMLSLYTPDVYPPGPGPI